MKEEGCESMINAALPLYVLERSEDGREPNSISILPVLLEVSALPPYRCSTVFQSAEKTLQSGFAPSSCFQNSPLLPCDSTLCIHIMCHGVSLSVSLVVAEWFHPSSR